MPQKFKLAGIISWFTIISIVYAATDNISLDSCFQAALRQSEVMADQQEQVIQAEEHYKQAFAVMLPNINANANYFAPDTSGLADPSAVEKNQTTLKLTLAQPLFRGFRDFAALKQNQQLIKAQKEAYQWAALQLYQDTVQAFYLVLTLEKDLIHLNKELTLYKDRIEVLKGRVRIGRSRKTEVLTVDAARATLVAQIEQVRAQLVVARELLAFLTGKDAAALQLVDTAGLPTKIDSLDNYLGYVAKRPDVSAAQAHIDAAQQNIEIANGNYWPSVDLGGNYYFKRPEGTLQDSRWDAQLNIALPVFSWDLNPAKQSEAQSILKQNQLAKARLQRSAEQAIRSTYQQLQYDLAQVTAYQEAADLSEKNYQAVVNDYDSGLVNNLDVLQALVAYQDSARALSKSELAVKTDYFKLEAIAAKIEIPQEQAKL